MADDVVESPWCVVCRRSSAVKWRKHVFTRTHQVAAQRFLQAQASQLQDLLAVLETSPSTPWRCVFCKASGSAPAAAAHFGGQQHRKQVEDFCRHHRCDADKQTRPKLWIDATQRRELETAASKQDETEEEGGDQVEVAVNDHTEEFLTSAASRLQQVLAAKKVEPVEVLTKEQQHEKLWGPQAAGGQRIRTVTSSEGVVQNPLGRHEGRRVWGGGIVKMKKTEWIPWVIDQLVKEEQAGQPETTQPEDPFVHRVTELARGEGLSSIASVPWGANVGNVHSAAIPPWMVKSEEEYKQCNRREQATAATPTGIKQTSDKKDIFSELKKKDEYGPDWLPNFGGVWHEGPRSKSKQAFRSAVKAAKKPVPSRLMTSRSSPPSLPLPPTQPPPPIALQCVEIQRPQAEQTAQPPAPVAGRKTEVKEAVNPLDAKKQQLQAQKERLRAKLAARRQK